MAKSHHLPKRPTRQYLEDIAWLRAFVHCGWSGKRAVSAADEAVTVWYQVYMGRPTFNHSTETNRHARNSRKSRR